jgi:PAS domain-containing protein
VIVLPLIVYSPEYYRNLEREHIVHVFYAFASISTYGLFLGRIVSDKNDLISTENEYLKTLDKDYTDLKVSRHYFTKLFQSGPNLIFTVKEEDGALIDINDECRKLLLPPLEEGHRSEDLKVWDIMRGEDWEMIRDNLDQATNQFEINLKRWDEIFLLCQVDTRRLLLNNDEVHFLINAIDITEKKEQEEKLQMAAEEKLELTRKIAEYKMMALRSAMSPHFIFNCLNSIQLYILKNDKNEAIHYLTIFSKLVRNILDISTINAITLEAELEMLRYYIELEQMRFQKRFSVEIEIDENIDLEDTEIPPLLIQPYVENAIIHGLSHKKEAGKLLIALKQDADVLRCIVEDNGVGREYARIMKEKRPTLVQHKSRGMTITRERLTLLNDDEIQGVDVIDLKDENNEAIGTKVEILINLN